MTRQLNGQPAFCLTASPRIDGEKLTGCCESEKNFTAGAREYPKVSVYIPCYHLKAGRIPRFRVAEENFTAEPGSTRKSPYIYLWPCESRKNPRFRGSKKILRLS